MTPTAHRSARPRVVAALLAATLLLGGCAGPAPDLQATDAGAEWQRREQRLASLLEWTATGKLALNAGDESWSARMRWAQDAERYAIRLSGPLGQGALSLEGAPGAVELRTAKGERYRAGRPGELLRSHAGWEVPVEGLRYWLLGRTQPGLPVAEMTLDDEGRIATLKQDGWSVEYRGYVNVAGIDLPARIRIEHPRVGARLAVSRWEI